jgi:hypothetical protein
MKFRNIGETILGRETGITRDSALFQHVHSGSKLLCIQCRSVEGTYVIRRRCVSLLPRGLTMEVGNVDPGNNLITQTD